MCCPFKHFQLRYLRGSVIVFLSLVPLPLFISFWGSANCCWSAGIVTDPDAYDQSKRMRTGDDYAQAGYSSPSPFHPPPPPVWGPHM